MKEAKYIKTIYLKLFRIKQFEKELFFSEDRRVLKKPPPWLYSSPQNLPTPEPMPFTLLPSRAFILIGS